MTTVSALSSLQRWPVTWGSKPHNPFLPCGAFGWGFTQEQREIRTELGSQIFRVFSLVDSIGGMGEGGHQ